jgi:Holliday junction resolvase RusA-like endonuclease
MQLIIKGTMPGTNEYTQENRGSRYSGGDLKKEQTERVFWACREQGLDAHLGKHNYEFTWYEKDHKRDPDNIHGAVKFIFDGLYKAGIIENDTQKYVGSIHHNAIEVDKNYPRVEVQIL